MGSGQEPASHSIQTNHKKAIISANSDQFRPIPTNSNQLTQIHTKMGIAEVLIDENGNFLGRDLKSWAKILGFYAVYYSFLGVLFYGFTVTYYLESRVLGSSPVGGKPAIANGRLDMPGAVVHPFTELMEDGAISRFTMSKSFIEQTYCAKMDDYFQNKEALNKNSVDCSVKKTSEGTCEVNVNITNAGNELDIGAKFGLASCKALTDKKRPMFTIDINKIIDWAPNNAGIHFDCYEYEEKEGKKLETQTYKFHWLTESSISAKYFPFHGVSSEQLVYLPVDNRGPNMDRTEPCNSEQCKNNHPYNKPFVGGYVSGGEGAFAKGEKHHFRCDVMSNKINRLLDTDSLSAAEKSKITYDYEAVNQNLRKLTIGFVEFGYMYDF